MNRRVLAGILAGTMWSVAAVGQTVTIEVTRYSHSPCGGGTELYSEYLASNPISVNLSTCAARVRITPDLPSTNMPKITFTGGPATLPVEISLGSAFSQAGTAPTKHGNNWLGLDASAVGLSQFYGGINGSLTGPINVKELFRFDTGGNINSSIYAANAGNGGMFIVEAASIPATGSVTVAGGQIVRIRSNNGDIAGTVVNLDGPIRRVEVEGGNLLTSLASKGAIWGIDVTGDIGTPSNPVSITTTNAFPSQLANIDDIQAARIYANISTPSTSTLRGDVRQIITTSGPFVGSLTTFAMQGTALGVPTIQVAGDIDADIDVATIKRPVVIGGILKSGRTIRVQQDVKLEAPVLILGSGGLKGQIIINADNDSHPWAGAIEANGHELWSGNAQPNQAPHYARSSVDLGGGAVGLAPFQLHDEDCDPPNGGAIFGHPAVQLRHYGPVTWGSGTPVTVEYKLPNWDSFMDVTHDFLVEPGPTNRDISIVALTSADFDTIAIYRIKPVRANPGPGQVILECADVEGNPPVADYEYLLNKL